MSGKRAKRKRRIDRAKRAVCVDQHAVNILELAKAAPNEKVDAEFIELALADLLSDIVYVEAQNGVVLVGDRADFDRARKDWLWFTRMQVARAVSIWRSGIFERYMCR